LYIIQHFISSTPNIKAQIRQLEVEIEEKKQQMQTLLDNKSSVEKLVNNIRGS
jgi:hypothetical protein